MTKIYYVRHGQSTYNAEKRYAGSTDVPLSELGLEQAQIAAGILEDYAIDHLICSPMLRTRQTAEVINQRLQLPIEIVEDLRELNVGVFETLTRAEIEEKYPERWQQSRHNDYFKVSHGGESGFDVQQRVFPALDQLIEKYEGQSILIVAHGFVGRVVYRYFNREISDEQFFLYSLQNCEVVEYEVG